MQRDFNALNHEAEGIHESAQDQCMQTFNLAFAKWKEIKICLSDKADCI